MQSPIKAIVPFSVFRWLGVSSLWVYHMVSWAVLICSFVFALIVGGVRFWLLPNIENYRETIARELSEATRQKITIGRLEGRLSAISLQLTLYDLALHDKQARPALTLARVDGRLSWWSVIVGEPRFDSIELDRPDLNIKRDARGVISVAGVELSDGADGGGLSDWLLRQNEIVIHNAAISWHDELRGAPEIELQHVDFRLDNDGGRHRFGLRAVPPERIAGKLDMRGDLSGRTVKDLAQWNGRLFAQLDYADIAAWRTWVDFPVSFPQGTGAVRVWVGLKRGEVADAIADVELAQVKTRLTAHLPELDLNALKGRVGWKLRTDGFDITTSQLGLTTQGGLILQPVDFQLRVFHAGERKPGRGELQASALDLEPLRALADHLPLDAELRKALDVYAPRGSVYELALKWTGTWPRPEQYSLKGRFVNLGINAVGRIPGFTGATGMVDGSERGGTLTLKSQDAVAELPRVFREKMNFDVLTAQVSWTVSGGQYDVRFNNIAFSNADLAGNCSGSYLTVSNSRGIIELAGSLTRADPRHVGRYIPLQVGEGGRNWLNTALVAGTADEVKLRLKGNLDEFPFNEGKSGLFEVTARVSGGVLKFADSWPRIENIEADLSFRGKRMEVLARSATMLGAKLWRVRAELPELDHPQRVLAVSGDAEGATSEFLQFIEQSPVHDLIDRFTDGTQAQGAGKLALKLTIPLGNTAGTQVAGVYTFINNVIQNEEIPFVLDQVNGALEFTESSVRVPNATMVVLGGPATLTASSQRDGVTRVGMAGRVSLDSLRSSMNLPLVQSLQGSTDWRAAVTLRKRVADVVLDSTLQGVASNLPAPLAKAAGDSLPLHLERSLIGGQQERLSITLGGALSMQLQRRRDGAQYIVERGTVSLGGTAAVPERPGIWVSGSLKAFDLDHWLALTKAAPGTGNRYDLAGLDVKFGTLDMFGRRFNDVAISGSAHGGDWKSVLAGRELVGEVSWRPQGRGKVTARMKSMAIPAASPKRPAPLPGADKEPPAELPALDIIADQFLVNDKQLGRLEVNAVPDGRDWKLERMRVTNPEATLNIEGLWQGWLSQPRTMVNVKLEVSDIGRLLTRLGQPEGIRRGTAKLEGPLSWAGDPTEIDYPTLSGNFVLEASRGQFVKLNPGVGKLLGILSLQSLPRRLTLDFRDIFSDGLAFDEIIGAVKVNRGVASTENFRIVGPAVRILMSGDVDLHAETQRLRVKVFPSMSDSLSVVGALIGGPIAGIASFLVQKALKDPLDQIAAYEYSITGTWSDPQAVKVSGQAPTVEQPR